jgi:hypothetical protein
MGKGMGEKFATQRATKIAAGGFLVAVCYQRAIKLISECRRQLFSPVVLLHQLEAHLPLLQAKLQFAGRQSGLRVRC